MQAGVHGDYAGQPLLVSHAGDGINGVVLQIRRDLHQQRRAGRQAPQPLHQAPQQGFLLQLPQTRRVGRAHIDHRIVGQGGE